jgi:hypothetical protein
MIIQTSESRSPIWWTDPWWEDSIYQKDYGLSLEEIRSSIDATRLMFDEEWTRQALEVGPPNVVLAILYGGKGSWPFENLMWLGKIAAGCSQASGVRRQLKQLMGQKTWGTLLELEVASWFVEDEWKVEMLKTNSELPTPDLLVQKNGVAAAVECKRFGAEQWEEWTQDLTMLLLRRMRKFENPNSPSFDVLLSPRISDLVWEEEDFRWGIQEELVAKICQSIHDATHSQPPRTIETPGICTVNFRPENPGSQRGVGGVEISLQAKMRRIVRNGVFVAARQLQNYGHGAVVVKADVSIPEPVVAVTLNGINRADESRLNSVAIVVVAGPYGRPVIWRNPLLSASPQSEALASAFSSIFPTRSIRI